ncbi:MAG: hypothetical protein QOD51_2567, partial [Candidatus Eremiobacteraeota bacterium]|nr:hypothetical protein [Candidatus Eremiobacteraeota bacterium]
MLNQTARPIRPQAAPAPRPTLIRTPRDSSLFRGWGVTL